MPNDFVLEVANGNTARVGEAQFSLSTGFAPSFAVQTGEYKSVHTLGGRHHVVGNPALADLAVSKPTTNPVPAPGALFLGTLRLATVGFVCRKLAWFRQAPQPANSFEAF